MTDKPAATVVYMWCNPIPDSCPRCGGDCCHGVTQDDGSFTCAGRCDSAGHHDEGVPDDDIYNNEPCWHA